MKPQDLSNGKGLPFYTDPELTKIIRATVILRQDPEMIGPCNLTLLMLSTGARVSEARMARVEDCYENYIHIPITKTGIPRDAEVSPELLPWYVSFVKEARDEGRILLFPSFRTSFKTRHAPVHTVPLSRFTAMRWWALVINKSGVRFLTSHAARKTFATWESERLSVFDLKDQLGHSSINTTEKYYRGSMPGRRWNKESPSFREEMKLI